MDYANTSSIRVIGGKGKIHENGHPIEMKEYDEECEKHMQESLEDGGTGRNAPRDFELDYMEARLHMKAMVVANTHYESFEVNHPIWGLLKSKKKLDKCVKLIPRLEKKLGLEAPWAEGSDVYNAALTRLAQSKVDDVRLNIEMLMMQVADLNRAKVAMLGGRGGAVASSKRKITFRKKLMMQHVATLHAWEIMITPEKAPYADAVVEEWFASKTSPPWWEAARAPDTNGDSTIGVDDMRRYLSRKAEMARTKEEVDFVKVEMQRASVYYDYITKAIEGKEKSLLSVEEITIRKYNGAWVEGGDGVRKEISKCRRQRAYLSKMKGEWKKHVQETKVHFKGIIP